MVLDEGIFLLSDLGGSTNQDLGGRSTSTIDGCNLGNDLHPLHHLCPRARSARVQTSTPELALVLHTIPHQGGQAFQSSRVRGLVRVGGAGDSRADDDLVEGVEGCGGEAGTVGDCGDCFTDAGVTFVGLSGYGGC